MSSKKRIVILASGRGSNFEALTKAIQSGTVKNAEVVALVCNRKGVPALERARELGVKTVVVESALYHSEGKFDRPAYEKVLVREITALKPDLICLAGYLLLLGKTLLDTFPEKIINIHPSLLPAFKGLKAHEQALKANVKETGCTVHWVTADLDSGPIIAQSKISVLAGDTVEKLEARLLPIEHRTYIEALKKLCDEDTP